MGEARKTCQRRLTFELNPEGVGAKCVNEQTAITGQHKDVGGTKAGVAAVE